MHDSGQYRQLYGRGLTLTFTDPPGTVHVIGAGNAQKQADTLRDLCKKSNSASCDFSPTKEERINAPARLVGDPIVNCQRHKVVSKLSYSDTVGQSNSVGTEVGVEVETNLVFAKAKASVTAKYEHEWTEKHEFGQEVEIDVEPGDMAWVAATSPIYRDTGDFTLTLGKTTWKLTDVYFDTADPKRTAMFLPDERALTPAEYKQMCTRPAEHQGLLRAPVAWVSLHRVGSDDHDRMVGGREHDPARRGRKRHADRRCQPRRTVRRERTRPPVRRSRPRFDARWLRARRTHRRPWQ